MVYWQAHITLNDWNNLLRLGGNEKKERECNIGTRKRILQDYTPV